MKEEAHPTKRYVIVVAGGSGARMKLPVPKQFLILNGKPVILHSIEAFINTYPDIEVIVGLPKMYLDNWNKLIEEYKFDHPVQLVEGGEERYNTVKNCLEKVTEKGIVGVHDAARPLVSSTTIIAAYKAAEMFGTAVPAIPLYDSIRKIGSAQSIAVDRSKYCRIQTPQCFDSELLKKAYNGEYKFTFTDDASVVEGIGETIRLVDGHSDNLKITTPRDLVIAEALMNNRPVTTPYNKLKLPDNINVLNKKDD